jgi:hypothetical protein
VGEAIDIAGAEDKAAAKLEGILSELVLTVASGAGTFAAAKIIAAKNVDKVGDAEVGDGVGLVLLVDQQREGDTGFFAEDAGIVAVAEADGGERSTFFEKGLLVFAQLRDVFAAKNSAVVAKKDDHCRIFLPQRAKANFLAVGIRQNDVCELLAESFQHDGPSLKSATGTSSCAESVDFSAPVRLASLRI